MALKITYTVEELVRYTRTVELPDTVETDEQIAAWVEENALDDWAQKGDPIENFSYCDAQEVAGWERA